MAKKKRPLARRPRPQSSNGKKGNGSPTPQVQTEAVQETELATDADSDEDTGADESEDTDADVQEELGPESEEADDSDNDEEPLESEQDGAVADAPAAVAEVGDEVEDFAAPELESGEDGETSPIEEDASEEDESSDGESLRDSAELGEEPLESDAEDGEDGRASDAEDAESPERAEFASGDSEGFDAELSDPEQASEDDENAAGEQSSVADTYADPELESVDASEFGIADEDDDERPYTGPTLVGEGEAADEADVEDTELFLKGLVEAIIFSSDKPQSAKEIARAARLDKGRVQELLDALMEETKDRGMRIVAVSDGYAFRTNPAYSAYVREFLAQRPVRLSRAQLETLSIIAYRQPITRPEVDDIRGVDSGAVVKMLLERELIRILGKKDEPGRPMIYGTTPAFLDLFSLSSLRDLPTLREFTELSDDSRAKFELEIGEPAPEGRVDPAMFEEDEEPTPEGEAADGEAADGEAAHDEDLGQESDESLESDDDGEPESEVDEETEESADDSEEGADESLEDDSAADEGEEDAAVSDVDEEEFPDDEDDDDDDDEDEDDEDDDDDD